MAGRDVLNIVFDQGIADVPGSLARPGVNGYPEASPGPLVEVPVAGIKKEQIVIWLELLYISV